MNVYPDNFFGHMKFIKNGFQFLLAFVDTATGSLTVHEIYHILSNQYRQYLLQNCFKLPVQNLDGSGYYVMRFLLSSSLSIHFKIFDFERSRWRP